MKIIIINSVILFNLILTISVSAQIPVPIAIC